jgi:hypothetical protein
LIKTAWTNTLETSTVSLSAGAEDPHFPLYRIFDRSTGRSFRPTSAETIEIKIDQGGTGTPKPIDRLIIPSGHGLEGMTLDIKYSDDDAAYTACATQWTGTEGVISKSWSPVTKRYWKFIITSPTVVPELAELFLTLTYEWKKEPAAPALPSEMEFNVEHAMTSGGQDRFLIYGGPKRRRSFYVARCSTSQRDKIAALSDGLEGALPFWLFDHASDWIFGRLTGQLKLVEVAFQTYSFDFDFLEVLP